MREAWTTRREKKLGGMPKNEKWWWWTADTMKKCCTCGLKEIREAAFQSKNSMKDIVTQIKISCFLPSSPLIRFAIIGVHTHTHLPWGPLPRGVGGRVMGLQKVSFRIAEASVFAHSHHLSIWMFGHCSVAMAMLLLYCNHSLCLTSMNCRKSLCCYNRIAMESNTRTKTQLHLFCNFRTFLQPFFAQRKIWS